MPKEDDVKPSSVIEMPNGKPKANPAPDELELWRLEGLDESGYFQPPDELLEGLREEGYLPPPSEEGV
jgi:hypothetical protein